MEKELNTTFPDIGVQLIPGHGGVFDVTLDGTLIYSKSDTGRFPNTGEIAGIVKKSI